MITTATATVDSNGRTVRIRDHFCREYHEIWGDEGVRYIVVTRENSNGTGRIKNVATITEELFNQAWETAALFAEARRATQALLMPTVAAELAERREVDIVVG
jgi:hypothetical protein